jgi:hypothetical protein
MRSPKGNALPIKILYLLAAKPDICLGRCQPPQHMYDSTRRFNIIFDLEMVLNLLFIRNFYKFTFLFKKSFLNFKKNPSFNAVLICSINRI